MGFSERSKLIALAIVHVFETGKPFGDYSAVAVLDDGAGISYGVNQFTHKSGSLYAVLHRYRLLGGILPPAVSACMDDLQAKTRIAAVAHNDLVKKELATLGKYPLMQRAQREIAFEKYLKPAITACEGSDFTLPLSLAVIYDSINHGSYDKIRDRVRLELPASIKPEEYEREWVSAYVLERDKWLNSVPRLAKTAYRTAFFKKLIKANNWELKLPITVQGVKLTASMFPADTTNSAAADSNAATVDPSVRATPQQAADSSPENTQPPPNADTTVEVKKEKVSLTVKIGAAFTFLSGLGINAGTLAQQKLSEMTPLQIGYLIGALGLIALAVWWYRKAAKGAQNRTLALIDTAADKGKNTVKLR